jgi:chromosome segregation ATPase
MKDQIRVQQQLIDDAQTRKGELDNEVAERRKLHSIAKGGLVQFKKTMMDLKVAFQRAEDKVEELKDAVDEDSLRSTNLKILRESLEEAKQQKEVHEGSFTDSIASLDEKARTMRAITAKLNEIDGRIKELGRTAAARKTEVQAADQKREHALRDKNGADGKVQDGLSDVAKLQEALTEANAEIEAKTETANRISGRVNFPPGETYEGLMEKYNVRRNELAAAQKKMGGSREELEAEKAKTATAHAQANNSIGGLVTLSETLNKTMHNRRDRWKNFQRFITVAAKINFQFLLGERGFRGQLVLDHKRRLLDLKVEPDITTKNDEGRDARTLSGGEKSFSQICLLLAIWEAMGSPIRCLDEFDVFMDPVNRNMSVNLLIEGARKSTGKQFILISPGSETDIPRTRDVNRIE